MIRSVFLSLFLVFSLNIVFAQSLFSGSFFMSFIAADGSDKAYPLFWQIQSGSDGGRMMLEIQDEMKKKGVSKRVLFNSSDSTWTMLMEYVNSKIGTRIHAAAMYRDSARQQKIFVKKSGSRRVIEGYRCKKIILESAEYIAEAWTTDQLHFDLCYIYQLLTHCGLMNEYVRSGDWFNWKDSKGMILEVTSTKKSTEQSYTMRLSKLSPGDFNPLYFNTNGFILSEIPEGQNCGIPVEAK